MANFLDSLSARRRFGMNMGLDGIKALCSALGEPQQNIRAIHIAGTNGKGATCAFLDSALRAASARSGRYTSPHLLSVNERFFLDNRPIDDLKLSSLAARVEEVARKLPFEITFFETLTAIAFLFYAEASPDFVILETGLGGRLDATNVCSPILTIITRIGRDHCDWLGSTLEEIAKEKAGIIKSGVPVLLAPNEECVRKIVRARACEVGAPYYEVDDLADAPKEEISLKGSFNRENARVALAALKLIAKQFPKFSALLDKNVISQAFANVVWPGRYQHVGRFLIDGAHNPPAARALVSAIENEYGKDKKFLLICGFCADKDISETISILREHISHALLVKTNNSRSLDANELRTFFDAQNISSEPCLSLEDALKKSGNEETLICGSLFLVGEALSALKVYPWGNTRVDPAELLSRPK